MKSEIVKKVSAVVAASRAGSVWPTPDNTEPQKLSIVAHYPGTTDNFIERAIGLQQQAAVNHPGWEFYVYVNEKAGRTEIVAPTQYLIHTYLLTETGKIKKL